MSAPFIAYFIFWSPINGFAGFLITIGIIVLYVFLILFLLFKKIIKISLKLLLIYFLFYILGGILFDFLGLETSSSLYTIIVLVYLVLLYFTVKSYSSVKVILLVGLFALVFSLATIPFPECDSYKGEYSTDGWIEGGAFPYNKQCSCLGFEKDYAVAGGGPYTTFASECIGIPTDFECGGVNISTCEEYDKLYISAK